MAEDTGWSRDRGETTSQTVIVLPVVLIILLVAIQGALFFHVSHVAGAAAAQGASAAAAKSLSYAAAIGVGAEISDSLVRDTGAVLAGPTEVLVTAEEVRVTVRALVPRIVPFFSSSVSRTVVEPKERFLTEVQR